MKVSVAIRLPSGDTKYTIAYTNVRLIEVREGKLIIHIKEDLQNDVFNKSRWESVVIEEDDVHSPH